MNPSAEGNAEDWTHRLGLRPRPRLTPDGPFLLALAAAPALWALLWLSGMPLPAVGRADAWRTVLSVVLWYPLVEELTFRGGIQGALLQYPAFRRRRVGISMANLAAASGFVAWHWFYQGGVLVLAVLPPALIFGYFRDRFGSIYASVCLHGWYNATFLLGSGAIGPGSTTLPFLT